MGTSFILVITSPLFNPMPAAAPSFATPPIWAPTPASNLS